MPTLSRLLQILVYGKPGAIPRPMLMLLAACVALALAFSLPVMRAGAQGVQLEVQQVKPVQVIEDVPLVAGKPVVVKVVVFASASVPANLEVALGAPRKSQAVNLSQGVNTFYVPIDSPTAAGNIEAQAIISSGESRHSRSETVQVIAPDLNRLNVVFLPVDWTNQDQSRNNFPVSYNVFAGTSSDFMISTYPIADNNVHLDGNVPNYMLTPQQRAISDGQGNINWTNLTAMYSAVALAGRRAMSNADIVVGVLPPNWFGRYLNEPETVGLEFHSVKHIVTAQVNSDYATLAHEVGHIFRQDDEYNFNVNPPDNRQPDQPSRLPRAHRPAHLSQWLTHLLQLHGCLRPHLPVLDRPRHLHGNLQPDAKRRATLTDHGGAGGIVP